MKYLAFIILLLASVAAEAQVRYAVMTDTNSVLLAANTNLFTANSNILNKAVGGVNTNLSGIALASGTVTLTSGTNLVGSLWAYSTNRFLLSYRSLDGTLSAIGFKNITNGVNFTIFSANTTDTNQVDYAIIKP